MPKKGGRRGDKEGGAVEKGKKGERTKPKDMTIPPDFYKTWPKSIDPTRKNYTPYGGQAILPKTDLYRMVKFPKYVIRQRKKRILIQRMKVPPVVHQFSSALDKSSAGSLFKFLDQHRPETRQERNARLKKAAEEKSDPPPRPICVVSGLKEVTKTIEKQTAKLVIIAHDVDPLEQVIWMPTLCKKMGVPYCIVKSMSRLGTVVHRKTATCLAVCEVKAKFSEEFANIVDVCRENFNNKYQKHMTTPGHTKLGSKVRAALKAREKADKAEENRKRTADWD